MKSVLRSGSSRFALAMMLLTGLLVGATSAMAEASPRPASSSTRAGTASLPTVRASEAVPATRARPAHTWSPRAAAPAGGGGQATAPAPAPAPAPQPEPTTPEAPALEVMSFNIRHGRGMDHVVDLERTARLIEASGADIVGLQEVDQVFSARSGLVDQPAWLAERLGMHVVFGGNLASSTGWYGTAILSRYPIVSSSNTRLPDLGNEPRGLLEAVVDVDGTLLRVLNTHLTHLSAEERVLQVAAVADVLGGSPTATVLTGDLNTLTSTGQLDPLLDVLADGWGSAGQGKGATYPADRPQYRIDYVLVSPDLSVASASVTSTTVSDHLPVTVGVSR